MSQFDFGTINPDTKTGTALASDLNSWRDALNTLHRGATRPTYAQGGMAWVKEVSGTMWQLVIYDGTTDIVIAEINPSTDVFSPPNDSVGNAAMQVNAINTGNVINLAITAAKLAADAVETAKILNLAVTDAKIANSTLTFGKLAASIIASQGEAEAGTATNKLMTAQRVAQAIAASASGAFEDEFFHAVDAKGSGSDGGTFTSGAWRTRDLGNNLFGLIDNASLSNHQITLPAGTYFLLGSAPAYRVNSHKTRFRNITDGTDVITGTTERAGVPISGSAAATRSVLSGRFVIPGSKAFELQHRCDSTRNTDGFGQAAGFGVNERYSEIMIWKVG